ncbi:MAG TPA: YggT family protein [Kineosporiaceae bacterium]|nr:YggT family protein [Kineosporiaceae bacterium]
MIIFSLLKFVIWIFLVILIIRLVFDWVQMFSRDWRPRGPVLVVAEGVYSATDPPLRALRRVLPPLRIGAVALDLAYTALFLIVVVLLQVLPG